MNIKSVIKLILLSQISLATLAYANNAPVINAYQYNGNENSQQPLTMLQQLARLKQQLNNLQATDLPNQIQQLQQKVQSLQGEVQVQAHEITKLREMLTKPSSSKQIQAKQSSASQIQVAQASTGPITKVASQTTYLSDQAAYAASYNLIKNNQYNAAIASLQNYLKQYPTGRYVSNAHYWLGELYLLQNNVRAAVGEFKTVISQYPQSYKLKDAMLKLGFIYYDNGQLNKAKVQLQKVTKKFPNTTVARLASTRLQDINQQINANNNQQITDQINPISS